ncbi:MULTISPECIES: sensor histidine kinase [Streptomyces]|jgi:signal transduction histidine kinase|uniref:histidine kinase n=4 Tax=Streptomyces TaxID=1883 RepID=A0A8D3WGV1_STRFA|nr:MULTISPECIES: ATP-binding protein [Streptomyces]MDF9868907.1 signal transduction histidine kinase [Streptomyces pratensis]TPN07986.1 sensor histidine kinase [Mesorhizobium sp. B2-3-3]MDX2622075.1 sensor histidine kinase [Streptomyces sp. WI03-5b]MYT49601.1 ATP-binding protein [Streptomyces sp. SID7815]WSZ51599.1 sensor histidine kinase [[Kitasatospora] papulosa]
MVRVESPPTKRDIPVVRAALLPVVLMAGATAAGAVPVTGATRAAVVVCGAVATAVVATLAVVLNRRRRAMRVQRAEYERRIAALEHRIATYDQETERLSKELLPAAIRRLRASNSPQEVMRDIVDADASYRNLPKAQRALVLQVLDIIDNEEAMRDSAQRAFVSVARRVQAIVHRQASELREMEDHHGRNPDVFDDLLRIDHGTALIGRLADSIAVLGGARPSRQWPKAVPLFSVLRGAMSRILEYQRVDLHSIAKVAIVGTAVEPLIHACAELLDNATRYSPPQTRVHVTAVEVQTGIAIEIEDGGVSLSEEARVRAENMLAQAQAGINMNDLGESPRLGMAVVGRLARMYQLQVSLRQSAYGGVRAVLIVPRDMITTGPAPGIAHGIGATSRPQSSLDMSQMQHVVPPRGKHKARPAATGPVPSLATPVPAPAPAASAARPAPAASAAMGDDEIVVTEWTEGGLPQRRSRGRAPLGSHNLPQQSAPAAEPAARNGHNGHGGGATAPPGLWLEAFTQAVNGVPKDPGNDTDSDDAWDKGDEK